MFCACMAYTTILQKLEMQQYIEILPYRDTLGSDTVLIHIKVMSIYPMSQYNDIKTVYLYIQYFMTDAVVVYYGCQFYSSATTV